MSKWKAPEGVCSISVEGAEMEMVDGVVEATTGPQEQALASHGFVLMKDEPAPEPAPVASPPAKKK